MKSIFPLDTHSRLKAEEAALVSRAKNPEGYNALLAFWKTKRVMWSQVMAKR